MLGAEAGMNCSSSSGLRQVSEGDFGHDAKQRCSIRYKYDTFGIHSDFGDVPCEILIRD
jgi:hypothetical protein